MANSSFSGPRLRKQTKLNQQPTINGGSVAFNPDLLLEILDRVPDAQKGATWASLCTANSQCKDALMAPYGIGNRLLAILEAQVKAMCLNRRRMSECDKAYIKFVDDMFVCYALQELLLTVTNGTFVLQAMPTIDESKRPGIALLSALLRQMTGVAAAAGRIALYEFVTSPTLRVRVRVRNLLHRVVEAHGTPIADEEAADEEEDVDGFYDAGFTPAMHQGVFADDDVQAQVQAQGQAQVQAQGQAQVQAHQPLVDAGIGGLFDVVDDDDDDDDDYEYPIESHAEDVSAVEFVTVNDGEHRIARIPLRERGRYIMRVDVRACLAHLADEVAGRLRGLAARDPLRHLFATRDLGIGIDPATGLCAVRTLFGYGDAKARTLKACRELDRRIEAQYLLCNRRRSALASWTWRLRTCKSPRVRQAMCDDIWRAFTTLPPGITPASALVPQDELVAYLESTLRAAVDDTDCLLLLSRVVAREDVSRDYVDMTKRACAQSRARRVLFLAESMQHDAGALARMSGIFAACFSFAHADAALAYDAQAVKELRFRFFPVTRVPMPLAWAQAVVCRPPSEASEVANVLDGIVRGSVEHEHQSFFQCGLLVHVCGRAALQATDAISPTTASRCLAMLSVEFARNAEWQRDYRLLPGTDKDASDLMHRTAAFLCLHVFGAGPAAAERALGDRDLKRTHHALLIVAKAGVYASTCSAREYQHSTTLNPQAVDALLKTCVALVGEGMPRLPRDHHAAFKLIRSSVEGAEVRRSSRLAMMERF